MASLSSFLSSASSFTTHSISANRSQYPFNFPKTISCKSNEKDDNNIQQSKSIGGRRDLLISLGGLYGAATSLAADHRLAIASPIQAPDLSKCGPAEIPAGGTPTNCCPPFNSSIIDFVPPPRNGPLRVRPAAQLVDGEYLKKYQKAVELMRALPADDPRNFTQQANVHCAYCDGAYDQIGFPKLDIQVHNSWIFFPWHRYYLYFHERILGKLIGDDNFAIPFWNWDSPDGMVMPAFYTNKSSSLYNNNRDPSHQPPVTIDLDGNAHPGFTKDELIDDNLKLMYRQMISNGKNAKLFMGSPYRAGDQPSPGSGSIEQTPHGPVHVWTGNPANPNDEDMGTLYSAARDPIFFAHHGNIDRLWSVWKTLGGKRRDFKDLDWLDASFLFYDENAQLVRVKIRDCLETETLGYKYQEVENPWLNSRPTPKAAKATTNKLLKKKSPQAVIGVPAFPITLDKPVSVTVKRPKRGRSKKEKDDEEEVLLVEDIVVSRHEFVKFDVYINSPEEDKLRPSASEFAGSFVNLSHKHGHAKKVKDIKTNLRLGITDLLEDLRAEDDDSVVVTLVPRSANGNKVKVGGLRIEFSS
ncbi:polyphenol oxidase, chloroplastic [Dendrobium catenatum]|uniref:Polyphenol oxidase, chloroplastic n=1 Tax=Dendrobium catenatum TaxID=906689 RepID=A0A2I0VD26_9ASPA|nr:polyphenol oxidase, chloroplastic [Dendrobium catenatum]PKU61312.1 Polyphenol oxidase, chloroplastic [Dendrobium catenatum]